MAILKRGKDWALKFLWGKDSVPAGLYELSEYFRHNGPIKFTYINKDGLIIAKSQNLRIGKITTSGASEQEIDKNIKDAILTAFSIPSSYASEAKIVREGQGEKRYALA